MQRYMTGLGAPSMHGHESPRADYAAGRDNLSSPRDMAGFMRRMHGDGALAEGHPSKRLTTASNQFFWHTLNLDANRGDNTKGYLPALDEQIANWDGLVTVFNKAGSNRWTNGFWAHRPQLGNHHQGSEAGRLAFSNGDDVYYTMFVDEADEPQRPELACIGLAVVAAYSGVAPSNTPASCT